MKYLNIKQIIKEQEKLINKFGGSYGIRDVSLLESAYYNSLQSFGEIDLYPSIEEKITSLVFSIAKNHPFIDGNKRIATYIMLINLEINNIELECTNEELIKLGLNIAQDYTKEDILKWIINHKVN
jgi:death on curing protein